MPRAIILLPGVGAAGDARGRRALTSGPSSALVNASRSVIYAYRDVPSEDWRAAGAERPTSPRPCGARPAGEHDPCSVDPRRSCDYPGAAWRASDLPSRSSCSRLPLRARRGAGRAGARAYVVQSSVDGPPLAARGADDPRAMASITKLMTALVAVGRRPLDDVVTVPRAAAGVGKSSPACARVSASRSATC